jgi:hypothetical protein
VRIVIIVSLSVIVSLVFGEIWVRGANLVPDGYDRIMHPYIELGGFTKGGYFSPNFNPNETLESFGYAPEGWLRIPAYPFGRAVKSVSERGRFLYRDRGQILDQEPLPSELRFFILGGSVAFGHAASTPEARWFVKLEEILGKDLRRPFHSIPAANHSHVTTQERIIQNLYVIPKRPSAMIILDGFNDCNTAISATRPGDPYGQGINYKRYESPLWGFLSDISKHSSLLRFFMVKEVENVWGISWEDRTRLMGSFADSVASVYYDNIAAMKRRCDQEKIPCFFFLQPEREITLMNQKISDFPDDPIVASYREILSRIKNYPYLNDLTHIFDKANSVYTDQAHFNDEGHEILAREIAKVVLESKKFQIGLQK